MDIPQGIFKKFREFKQAVNFHFFYYLDAHIIRDQKYDKYVCITMIRDTTRDHWMYYRLIRISL
jgi:hypothetical protein